MSRRERGSASVEAIARRAESGRHKFFFRGDDEDVL